MNRLKTWWRTVPDPVRRPIVLTVGLFLVLLAGSIGWLPGPGGIPLFLIGVAILASEFNWAMRLKNFILKWVGIFAKQYRHNHSIIITALLVIATIIALIAFMLF